MTIRLVPAVLSGGSGTRLWPLSTDDIPKQFHAIGSRRTMIQEAVGRFVAGDENVEVLAPLLIGSRRHRDLIAEQMAQIEIEPSAIVLEPFGRNSAPAAVLAARLAQAIDPSALVILMSADHLIPDVRGFRATVIQSAQAALENIVVFGVTPTAPETGYGYIESGAVIDGDVREVVRFAEKPDRQTAETYLASGRYLWNAGIFLFSPAVLLAEMERLAPDVLRASDMALTQGRRSGVVIDLDETAFAACPSISIDYAVMEKTDRAAVTPIGVEWADVGSWSELWRLSPRDEQDNMVRGDVHLIDTDGAIVWADSMTVGVVGVKDLIVVQIEDTVIVLPKSRAQDVKLLVEQVKARAASTKV